MTSRSIVVVVVMFLVGGTALAVQQAQITKLRRVVRGEVPMRGAQPPGAPEYEDDEELARRIAALEDRVARLTKIALDNRQMTQSAEGAVASEISDDEIDSIRDDLESIASGELFTNEESRDKFRAAVREEQERAMEEMREERMERFRREQDQMIAEFIEDNGLDDDQAAIVRDTLSAEREAAREIWESTRSGDTTFRDAREQFTAAREASDEKIGAVLDQEQYAAYSDMRDESWGGGGRGRARR